MSQQRATSNNEGPSSRAQNTSSETTDTNTSAIINLDDSEDEEADDTVEFVGIISPVSQTIDLCLSPSTSAAAAAAAASTSSTNSGDTLLKTANAEASATAVDTVLECPICLQSCIHPARLPCGHIFCFLCVKGVAYKNRRCAMCRREIPAEFLDHPQLVNGIDDICSTRATEDGYQWYYEGRNGWWQYDDRTSQDIEEAYKKGEKSCTILVAGYVYIVDLEALLQQRQNEPTRCRRVKRDLATIPKKGVAGLRIEGNTVTTDTHFLQHQFGSNTTSTSTMTTTSATPAANFISTIAATDAAIRIASDIIGSTLAHADELTRGLTASNISDSVGDLSGEHAHISNSSIAGLGSGPHHSLSQGAARSLASSHSNSVQDLMRSATEDLLHSTHQVFEDNQHAVDLFEQTLNDIQALTLRNLVDSSEDENDVTHETDASEQLEASSEPTGSQIIPSREPRSYNEEFGNGPLEF
ncbi:E3 ubiquitin-protein ligase RNF146-B isoform X1 [Scaptodrosophila lebanonensis]|uniref:E3 ubiquitin-protein ligase n=1 Tax=Drosophila lebanonensis TaxID=7225 RepID=A0A6J2TMX7_DROLE|nr:E3 ubiquitin-protein ligase RNF146-B isoform X1 [Scaptodrosophila lebanonensis]